jgi:hypothetical protein
MFYLAVGGVLALIFGAIGLYILSKKKETAEWPVTRGRVISSTLVRARDLDGEATAEARVTYEYNVGGQTFRASRVKFGFTPPAKLTVSRYPTGCEVDVFYDPKKPADAVLERGTPKQA